jgi:arabinose-5-phosphate isomerase
MDILNEIRNVIEIEAIEIHALLKKVDDTAVEAVNLLYRCKGRVIVSGMGKAGLVGRKLAATLSSTGTPAIFVHPAEAIHGDLGIIGKQDIVIVISNSGETEEVLKLIPHFKRFKINIISLTGNPNSTLAKLSDVVLDVGTTREACPIGCAPMASTTTTLVMGDALAAALMVKRRFSKKHFVIFHPGGVLGKRLLLNVDGLMVTGDDVPLVNPDTKFKDFICEITSKSLGAAFVVDAKRLLLGIFTDGDLRRLMQASSNGDFLNSVASDVMIKNPVKIRREMLAAEAIQIMEEKAITILPVVDKKNAVVGALHMHSLIRAGLA